MKAVMAKEMIIMTIQSKYTYVFFVCINNNLPKKKEIQKNYIRLLIYS
jgi:hypothetical protein